MTSPPISSPAESATASSWSAATVVARDASRPPAQASSPEAQEVSDLSELRLDQLLRALTRHVHDAKNLHQFAEATLVELCRSGIAIGGTWHLHSPTEDPAAVAEPIASQIPNEALAEEATQQWLHECRMALQNDAEAQVFASPQIQGLHAACIQSTLGDQRYVVTLLAIASTVEELRRAIQLLPIVTTAWHFCREAIASHDDLRITAALVDLVATVQTCPTLDEACRSVVGQLKRHLDCKFVALSLLPGKSQSARGRSKPLRLATISGLDHFDPNSTLAQTIEAAHDECALRDSVTSWPPLAPNRRELSIAHRQIVDSVGVELIVSTPLRNHDGQVIGVLSVAGALLSVGSPETQNLLTALSLPIASVLSISRRAQPSGIRRFLNQLAAQSMATQRNLLMALAAAILFTLCLPWPYRIACRCRLEPEAKRFAVAPYDGTLETTFVRPGDRVEVGDVLARMEQREINWELAGVVAQQERVRKTLDSHMANHETPKAMISEAELAELAARRQLLEYQRDNMEIRSPVAGLVLSGSHQRREHFPVGIGEKLYEIAEISPLRVEVGIPAEDIAHVKVGMQVQIRLHSERLQPIVGKLESIRPRAVVRQQRNVFIAELSVPNPDGKLRPGMEGDARIVTARHTLAWNWFHKPWQRFVAWWSLALA